MPDDIAERFAKDTGGWTSEDGQTTYRPHEMTVLHDDGLYRHIRFRSPDRGAHWFDLITWPGHLTVNGDCGTYTFARVDDMFEFFRGHEVNPGYWAEKVRGETRTESYSQSRFRQYVTEYVWDVEARWPGLAEAVERDIFGELSEWNTEHEDGAREALDDFRFGEFCFPATWEWDLSDWDWWFLWCCHAIVWGIGCYDKAKVAVNA